MSQMWRQNKNADTVTYGVGGFSSILPKMQIYMRDPFQEWKNRRNQNARRLDAVQTDGLVCTAFIVFQAEVKEKRELILLWRNME